MKFKEIFSTMSLNMEDFCIRAECIRNLSKNLLLGYCIVSENGAFWYLAIEFCYRPSVFRWFGRRRWWRARRWRHLVRVFDATTRPVIFGSVAGHPITSGRPVVANGPSHFRFMRSTGYRVQPSCTRCDFRRRARITLRFTSSSPTLSQNIITCWTG